MATDPGHVVIWYDENLEPRLSEIVVYDVQRQEVQTGSAKVDPADHKVLQVALKPNLPAGTYTVVWHAVSADDGHATAGVFAFGVGITPQAPIVSPQQLGAASGQDATEGGVLGRWLIDLALALLLGASAFALYARPPAAGLPRLRWLIRAGFAALALGEVLRLLDEAALTSNGRIAAPAVVGLLVGTRFGLLWLGRLAVVGIGAAALAERERATRRKPPASTSPRTFLLVTFASALILAADLDWSGHAAAGSTLAYARLIQATLAWSIQSPFYLVAAAALVQLAPGVTLLLNGLHLLAVSIWIGGIIALAVCRIPESEATSLFETIRRYAHVASTAMLVVFVTGLYNTWLYLANLDAYTTTDYGRSLLVKHLAILALLATAVSTHFITVPVLSRGTPRLHLPGRIGRYLVDHPFLSVRIEAILGVVVLLTTGVLTSLGPTRSPNQLLAAPSTELALAAAPLRVSLDLGMGETAGLTLDPGRVGPNAYALTLVQNGTPVENTRRVDLELSPVGLASAADVVRLDPAGPGHFVGHGLAPSTEGIWSAALRVYRSDGSIGVAGVTFQSTTRWAAAATPEARNLLAQARDAMTRLRSARMVEQLGNGAGALVLNDYTFVSPDTLEISGPRSGTALQIGSINYFRGPNAAIWQVQADGSRYQWPDATYDELVEGVGGIIVGDATVQGYPCAIVAFYSPRVEGVYEEWIGRDDRLVHEEIMAAPSHFMVNLYYDFNRPSPIAPPVGASSGRG